MTRKYFYMFLMLIPFVACGKRIPASAKTDSFYVSGNCGMCKKRIEKSLNIDGVYKANWNKETKTLTVVYEPSIINLNDIKKCIAKAGHDNGSFKAEYSVYENLHSCCKYERK